MQRGNAPGRAVKRIKRNERILSISSVMMQRIMYVKKSIPCPDMHGASFVKGGNFVDLKDVALAASLFYYKKLVIR